MGLSTQCCDKNEGAGLVVNISNEKMKLKRSDKKIESVMGDY